MMMMMMTTIMMAMMVVMMLMTSMMTMAAGGGAWGLCQDSGAELQMQDEETATGGSGSNVSGFGRGQAVLLYDEAAHSA